MKQPKYDPAAKYICVKGAITIPSGKGGRRRIEAGSGEEFTMTHRADDPATIEYLVDELKIITPAPGAKGGK